MSPRIKFVNEIYILILVYTIKIHNLINILLLLIIAKLFLLV